MKLKKLSAVALIIGALFSNSILADEKADKKFTDEASYAVGALFGTDLKGLIDAQKEVITYDNTRILAGIKDALESKVELADNEEIVKTLQAVDEKLRAASQAKAAEQAKKAKAENDKFAAEFKKKTALKKQNRDCYTVLKKQVAVRPLKPRIKSKYIIPANSPTVRYLIAR